ncbi:MAG: phosphoenolpyruvate carboxykinase (GTP) [Blastocatellia bacterium]|nr:phosphoenolpyruvate carboxykinase (GTP) [Blastocatellia bacterium]MCS7158406.1 phosphoenolpyruvate carboxykinase (GTP) [Blastocatellia bacterium]MCX7752912.1 phosphoenolpyruvate carboxykinase (GTP) [Blastocatellia bacterium]MDW8167968.1 phosphoenolpyruvate carboxykinase (GTP) [Acidobacteriota bacterium]MDW8256343.1 phosphoenolpyruvate carboxykinase (GTP) [Acidobacteriota bacterium]
MCSKALNEWIEEVARTTQPDRVIWCDGSENEYHALIEGMLSDGTLLRLNEQKYPNCYLHRSHPTDVARTEHLTFICTPNPEDAGPTNNWMSPQEAHERVGSLFRGCMKGRTMYIVPYLMGPPDSPFSEVGVEVTDSPYVVVNMRIMTRMGKIALEHLGDSDRFVRGLHSLGDLSPERRYICHFPEERAIWSIGSGYGGNALLGKKCHSLRIASVEARDEGWLAEHMLIIGVEDPEGNVTYLAGAFPSACGKTNLAMLVPPPALGRYKVWTVGDDIAWLRFGPDGRLWAVNPETGFFGVAPGTSMKTNPNAMVALSRNSIFTNVALTPEGTPWWEGMSDPPEFVYDWQGKPWTPASGRPAAHPNARFTAPARQCPSISPRWEDPQGVPISAILFGGRRARVAPLVYEAFDWAHGVFVGASMASETTAAAMGEIGIVRRDPMAMLPFCGYNMADYFRHWLRMGTRSSKMPRIFHVNWFRTDESGRFLWPGFGENLRVLLWIIERVNGRGDAQETPIGYVPTPQALDLDGLALSKETVRELLRVDPNEWRQEAEAIAEFFRRFGNRLPEELWQQHRQLMRRLG